MPGQVGKGLAVDFDIGFVKPIDKLAVAHVIHAASCIDTDDPEAAELAFFQLTVSKGKDHGAFDCLSGYTVCFAATAKVSSGGQHVFFSSAVCGYVICYSWHLSSPLHYQHTVDSSFVSFVHDGAGTKVAFQFGTFLGLDVCAFGMMAHDLTGAGKLEALGGRAIGFDLRHVYISLFSIYCFQLSLTPCRKAPGDLTGILTAYS